MELRGLSTSAHTTLHSVAADVTFALILVGGLLLWKGLKTVLLEPWLISRAFQKQGVRSVPYQLSLSKLRLVETAPTPNPSFLPSHPPHRVSPLMAPRYYEWRSVYGDIFVFWFGYRAVVPITKLEHVKEILYDKSGVFEKPVLRPDGDDFGSESMVLLEGDRWAMHRRIVTPAFFAEKLKAMTPTIVACSKAILDKWGMQIDNGGSKEVEIYEEFKVLTADVIAHCAFGSSYEEGRQFFEMQQEQQEVLLRVLQSIYIPGVRRLPTPQNRLAWRLKSRIEAIVQNMIARRGQDDEGDDLLGVMLDANRKALSETDKTAFLTLQEIVDECKLFFLAGQETSANMLVWTFELLAQHTHWQEKAREEVLCVCGRELPTYEQLHGLKVVGMILNEALRLFPPVPYLIREARKATKLGNMHVPAKTMFLLPFIDLQYDRALWGDDAHDFNPERFAKGIGSACTMPAAFCPFSMGPRHCLGQNFAMLEARAVLATALQRFTFTLSPGYMHCPTVTFHLTPKNGVQIILEKL